MDVKYLSGIIIPFKSPNFTEYTNFKEVLLVFPDKIIVLINDSFLEEYGEYKSIEEYIKQINITEEDFKDFYYRDKELEYLLLTYYPTLQELYLADL
jgi:hypothetical protein